MLKWMNFKGKKAKRSIAFLSAALMMLSSLTGCGNNVKMQEAFDAFIEQEFVDTMEQNWLNTHIFMENPENFGVNISEIPVEISPAMTDEYFEEVQAGNEACKTAFEAFDRDKLTDAQKDTYDIYAYILENSLASSSDEMQYFGFDFATLSGSHTQIPTLLADLQLRSEDDVKALVQLVESVKTYLDSSAAFLLEQQEHGTLMIDIEEVRTYCKDVVDIGMESSTLSSMKANVDAMDLSDDLKTDYKAQLDEAYAAYYIPAYENVIAVLDTLDESKNNQGGLATIDGGKEAYEIMFRNATGSSQSIEDVKTMLEDRLDYAINGLQMAAMADMEAYYAWMNGEVDTGYDDFETMLNDLYDFMQEDFPEIAEVDYEIKPLAEDLENSGVQAYYNIPALDNSGSQQIRVNTGADTLDIGSMSTFATVAHEGFPGHMYQYNYCYNLDLPNWRKTVAQNSGFVEGYATYVQLYALGYLEDTVGRTAVNIEKLNYIVQFMVIALADIGIHYEGWDEEALAEYMYDIGLNGEVAADLYDQLRVNPTVFLSYYVGYAQIMELRDKAEDELGRDFDEKEFHEALLESAGANFEVVERCIDEYIESAKGK